MIKVFIPRDRGKIKTNVRGFWRNDTGKTYYDYLSIEVKHWDLYLNKYSAIFKQYLKCILKDYNQEAVFYSQGNKGFIYNGKETIILTNRIYKEVSRANLKIEIKKALRDFSGCTVYTEPGKYYIEIYYK